MVARRLYTLGLITKRSRFQDALNPSPLEYGECSVHDDVGIILFKKKMSNG